MYHLYCCYYYDKYGQWLCVCYMKLWKCIAVAHFSYSFFLFWRLNVRRVSASALKWTFFYSCGWSNWFRNFQKTHKDKFLKQELFWFIASWREMKLSSRNLTKFDDIQLYLLVCLRMTLKFPMLFRTFPHTIRAKVKFCAGVSRNLQRKLLYSFLRLFDFFLQIFQKIFIWNGKVVRNALKIWWRM